MESQKNDNEKKQVAIIVADLSGLSSVTDNTIHDGITGLLTRFAEACEGVVALYGGTIERETGEKMIAFFGLDDKRESFTSQAVRAALDLNNRIEMMTAEQELPEVIGLRTGIATGEVIAGVIGTGKNRHYTVIGSPVEMARRIQDLAETGQILVGPEVFHQTQGQFEYHAMEPMQLKGQKKPVSIYELSGKQKEQKTVSMESARMITSIMVGRKQEARIIEGLIKQLLNGRGAVLNIEGVAGIGKSRLVAEIKTMEITGKVTFFEGRALSEGKNLSFHPIIQIIKSWSGIKEEDNQEESYRKLSHNINRIYAEQASEIIPFVATMMGYTLKSEARQRVKGIEGEALEKLILKNVRDLLSRATNLRPIALIVEDAHWADLSSISFMESLFKLARNHRLLFINVFRPGYKETGEHLKAFVKENLPEHGREITLKPLTEEESAELIGHLLNQTNLPEDIKSLIIRRSEGNPFFIEEVIRSFIDEGLVEVKENGFVVTEQIQYANIPETIDKVILSRIDRLDEKTRSLLKTASVIGRNFYYKVLEEAAHTIEEIDTRLEYLKETQLLNEHKHKEDVEFLFKHALAQQATYDSILQQTKKELHLKIARSIEKVFAEKIHEFYGVLAMHYGKAEVPEKMEEYLFKAGEQSLAAGASSEALNFFRQALDTYFGYHKESIDKQKVVDLEEKIGVALSMKGQNIEAVEYFDKVLEYYKFNMPKNEALKEVGALLYFLTFPFVVKYDWLKGSHKSNENLKKMLLIHIYKGESLSSVNPRRFLIECQYAAGLFRKFGFPDSIEAIGILSSISMFYIWTGFSLKTGLNILTLCAKILKGKETDNVYYLQYRYVKRVLDFSMGRWNEEMDFEEVARKGLRIGGAFELIVYLLYSGRIQCVKGQYDKTLKIVNKIFEVADYFENSHAGAQAYRLKALNEFQNRRMDELSTTCKEGIQYTIKTGHSAMLISLYALRSIECSMRLELSDAFKDLIETEKYTKERKMIKVYIVDYLLAGCYYEIARLKSKENPFGKVSAKLLWFTKKLIKNSKTLPSYQVEGLRLYGSALWKANKHGKAYASFEEALEIAEKVGARPELARTCFELGKCLMDPKSKRKTVRSKNGSEFLLKAKSMFEEMDLQWDLQEYERYMEG